jgi:zinc/manganese transport system substrate-binding protein/zinc transport system substrate-binding protein
MNKKTFRIGCRRFRTILACVFAIAAGQANADTAPLRVVTTVPDLAVLARTVGGDSVEVSSMASEHEDAHFVEAKPSFVKRLSEADAFISVGLGLERPGNIVAADAVQPMRSAPGGVVSRAMGDVHPGGNPHFSADPLSAVEVAALIAERFTELRPDEANTFRKRAAEFRRSIGRALVGEELDEKYDGTKLAVLYRRGALPAFLSEQGDSDKLAGWLGAMAPHFGTKAVDDHDIWPYFARTFGLEIVGHLEPKPGIRPTTKHLKEIIERMRAEKVKLVIKAPYYDPRHAEFVAEHTGAAVVELSHQAAASRSYIEFVDANVRALVGAIESNR